MFEYLEHRAMAVFLLAFTGGWLQKTENIVR